MREIEDFTDDRLKAWCIHCGAAIADVASNRDHVPTKSLLTKTLRERGASYDSGAGQILDYLPQVIVCRRCNSGFSPEENYFLCVLHAVMAGSLYPDPTKQHETISLTATTRHLPTRIDLNNEWSPFVHPLQELESTVGTSTDRSMRRKWVVCSRSALRARTPRAGQSA